MKKFISFLIAVLLLINSFSVNHTIIADDGPVKEEIIEEAIPAGQEAIPEAIVEEIPESVIPEEITEEEVPKAEIPEEIIEEENPESEIPESVIHEETIEEENPESVIPEENVEEEAPKEEILEEDVPEEEITEEEPLQQINLEERPVVSMSLGARRSSFDVYENYFELNCDKYTYDGNEHIPTLTKSADSSETEDFAFTYLYVIYGVEGSKSEVLAAKNAGNYILRATITCTPYTTILGKKVPDLTRVRIITGDYSFVIDKKEILPSSLKTSQLTYNGEVQFPTIFAGLESLVEGVDYEVVGEKPESKYAYVDGVEQTYTVNINLLNYKFADEATEDSTNFPIDYTIVKRPVQIETSYTDEYSFDGVYPVITATIGDKKINLVGQKSTREEYDYKIIDNTIYDSNRSPIYPASDKGYNYKLEPGEYIFKVTFINEFGDNNIVSNGDSDISYEITKIEIDPDFNALYYIPDLDSDKIPTPGKNQIPTFRAVDLDGKVVDITGHTYIVDKDTKIANPEAVYDYNGNPLFSWSEVGSYYVYLKMDEELASHYQWSYLYTVGDDTSLAEVGYRINKRNVEFAGWDFEGDSTTLYGYLGTYRAGFKWVKDDENNISLEYNGFNPFQFIDERGYHPIPKAKYTYTIDGTSYDAKGILREDCNYDPSGFDILKVKLNVGNYNMFISLDNDNYSANRIKANFDVTPKPVTISWSNTIIPFDSDNLDPDCAIEGLAPIDEYGFKLVKEDGKLDIQTDDKLIVDYSYYKFNADGQPVKVADAPLDYVPDEEGRYAVEAVNLVYKKTGYATNNYVIVGDNLMTSYIVGDIDTEETDGEISVITIDEVDKEKISSLVLKTPSKEDMELIIASQPTEVANALQAALNDGKNINIYLEARDVTPAEISEKGLILPTQNAIVIDLKLYACIDGSLERYQLTDTGNYKPDIQVTLTQAQAESIGYNSNRYFYIARYHGDSKAPDSTQMANPNVEGSGEDTTYTFSLRSDKFSDFAIYTANKPTPIPTYNDHVVPYTGE